MPEFWMTSGKRRLRVKEGQSYAQRAQARAALMYGNLSRRRSRGDKGTMNIQHNHPRFHQRAAMEDSGSDLDWSCPIARRGIVADGGLKRKRPESDNGRDEPREPPQARSRIRDPNSSNYVFSRKVARKSVPVPPPPKPYARPLHEAGPTHPPHRQQHFTRPPAHASSYTYPPPRQPQGLNHYHQGSNYPYEASFQQEPRQLYSQTGNGILAAALSKATSRAHNEPLDTVDEGYYFDGDTDRSCQEVHANSFCEHPNSLGGDTSHQSTQSHQSGLPVTRLFRDGLEVEEVDFFDQQTHGGHINNHVTSGSWEMERFLDMEDPGLSSSLRVDQAQTNYLYQHPQNTTYFACFSNARSDPSHEQCGSMPKSKARGIVPNLATISQGILPQSKLFAIMPSKSLLIWPRTNQQGGLLATQSMTTEVKDFYQESESNIHYSSSDVLDFDLESAYTEVVNESYHKPAVPKSISTPFRSSPSVASSIQLSPCSVYNESVVDYANHNGANFLIQQNTHFSAASGVEECNSHGLLRQVDDYFDYRPPQAASFPQIEQGFYEPDDCERGMPFNDYGEEFQQNGFRY